MPADQGLVDSVSNENTKVGAGAPSFLMNLALSNAVNHQNATNSLFGVIYGALGKKIVEQDISEALAESVTGQQAAKVAQTTLPETGQGK